MSVHAAAMLHLLYQAAPARTLHQGITFTSPRALMATYANIAAILQVLRPADHALTARTRSICTLQNIREIMSASTVGMGLLLLLADHAQKVRLKSTSTFSYEFPIFGQLRPMLEHVGRLESNQADSVWRVLYPK